MGNKYSTLSAKNIHAEHRQRLKKRFISDDLDSFETHNIIELVLFFSIPQGDTNELAHKLLKEFGSLAGVFDAPYDELLKVKGVGEHTATLIKLLAPLSRKYMEDKTREKEVFDSCEAVGEFLLAKYRFRQNEILSVLCLDQNCRFISWEQISSGTVNATAINTRKIIEVAVKTSAHSIILSHNHPNGLAEPSPDDIRSTMMLVDALNVISVKVIDHIIIGGEDYISLANSQQYEKLFR